MGPAIITTIGILFLLSELRRRLFDRTWPIILLVIGAVKLLQSSVGAVTSADAAWTRQLAPTPDGGARIPPAPPSEVSHG